MEKDCIIMSLVYIERMLSEAAPALCICGSNWKSIILSGMALASKVWDDLSMLNVDFSKIGNAELHHLNMLEVCPHPPMPRMGLLFPLAPLFTS